MAIQSAGVGRRQSHSPDDILSTKEREKKESLYSIIVQENDIISGVFGGQVILWNLPSPIKTIRQTWFFTDVYSYPLGNTCEHLLQVCQIHYHSTVLKLVAGFDI